MRKLLPALLVGVLFSAAICACSHPRPVPTKPRAPENLDELKKSVAAILARTHVPGVGIALVTKDKVLWAGGVGKADLASGRDVDGETMFRIGSITKGFVALAILQLQEKGKISLDTIVREVAPEVPIVNQWEQTDPVRVAHLLEHTAGFDDFPLAEFFDYSGSDTVPLLETFQRFPEPLRARWRPGMFGSYSNPGYGVAGYVVEKITGQPCGQYIADNILGPLGMSRSGFSLTREIKATLAQGYYYNPPRPIPYLPILLRPAGEMKTSPNEIARFVRMMLNRGSLDGVVVASPDSIARMETETTTLAARNGLKYGYGLGNMADVSHPFLGHWHDGGLDGFLSHYEYLPAQGVGYFFSVNDSQSGAAVKQINELLFAYVTRGMSPPAKPPGVPLDGSIENAIGFYELANPRQQALRFLTELLANGWTYIDSRSLFRRGLFPGTKEKLVYLGGGQIRAEKEVAASGIYCTTREGETYGCGALVAFHRMNPVWPITRFVLIALALLTMLTSILFALIWIPRKVLGRMRGAGHLSVRVLPLLATLSLVVILWEASRAPPMVQGRPDAFTISILVLSVAFPVLSVAALFVAIRSFRFEMNRAARIHSLVVSSACFAVSGYWAYWGLIGVRLWAL